MGSDGGGAGIQWADTLISAGATFLAAVLAAGVAVWLARSERKHARDQRIADDRKQLRIQAYLRQEELRWQMRVMVLEELGKLVEATRELEMAASLNDPSRVRFSITAMFNVAHQLRPFDEAASEKVMALAESFPESGLEGRREMILTWASDAEMELSAMHSAFSLSWYASEAGVSIPEEMYEENVSQATSASDESSAEESDAKSSS